MEFLFQPQSWLGMLGSIGLIFAGHVANKYVIPFLKVGKRKQYAQFIAAIADEVTDDLLNKYPEKDIFKHIDEAVDRVIEICGISQTVARRAVSASLNRK